MDTPDKSLILSLIKGEDGTIAERVIMHLTAEWPLSAKGLFNRIKERHMNDVSQQGVYKAINKLNSAQVLERKGKYYRISPEWLERLYKFSTEMSSAYEENETRLDGLP
ncbi:hypothetical protein KJ891_03575 [Candidatus Micrarchaeota archaeon]|nr:hypothetical protein [Candidatus Micrarchaeota archaeon]